MSKIWRACRKHLPAGLVCQAWGSTREQATTTPLKRDKVTRLIESRKWSSKRCWERLPCLSSRLPRALSSTVRTRGRPSTTPLTISFRHGVTSLMMTHPPWCLANHSTVKAIQSWAPKQSIWWREDLCPFCAGKAKRSKLLGMLSQTGRGEHLWNRSIVNCSRRTSWPWLKSIKRKQSILNL